jgi:CRISPR-associated protein Cas2
MHYAITYDISDDRLRNRLSKTLAKRGCWRLQKSVFLAPDFDPVEISKLRTELMQILASKRSPSDSLLCLPVERDLLSDNFWVPADLPADVLTKKIYKMLF